MWRNYIPQTWIVIFLLCCTLLCLAVGCNQSAGIWVSPYLQEMPSLIMPDDSVVAWSELGSDGRFELWAIQDGNIRSLGLHELPDIILRSYPLSKDTFVAEVQVNDSIGGKRSKLLKYDLPSKQRHPLFDYATLHDISQPVSHNSERLLYYSYYEQVPKEQIGLGVLDIDSGNTRIILNDVSILIDAAWINATDDVICAYAPLNNPATRRVVRLSRDGSMKKQLWEKRSAVAVPVSHLSCSPDGEHIAYVDNSTSELIVESLASGAKLAIYSRSSDESFEGKMIWNKGGTRLAILTKTDKSAGIVMCDISSGKASSTDLHRPDRLVFPLLGWNAAGESLAVTVASQDEKSFQLWWVNIYK